jgi:5-methylcytosine-specific restriction enzyme subunit McrC
VKAISLNEQVEWAGSLSSVDHEFLEEEFGPQFSVRREIRHGHVLSVINPNQFVGLVVLPSGTLLRIHPKVPVRNLVYMLSFTKDLSPFRNEIVQVESIDDVLEILAEMFARLVETQLETGLYRAYVDREENLALVRGRIIFADDLRMNTLTRQRTYCHFTEFSWDIEENQVIRQVAHALGGWQFGRGLRDRLAAIDRELTEVTPTNLAVRDLSRFRYNRFSEPYRAIHDLCRLFLEGTSFNEDLGPWNSRAFLVDMNRLFERFITSVLTSRATGEVTVAEQQDIFLDEADLVTMRPDLLIKVNGLTRIAADCKYKLLEVDAYKHADYYQLLSYCVACGVKHGVIIYPEHAIAAKDVVNVKNVGIAIERVTVNLGLEHADFKIACDVFADTLLHLALPVHLAMH